MPSKRTANYAALDRHREGETTLTYGERKGMRKACTGGIRSSSNLLIELQGAKFVYGWRFGGELGCVEVGCCVDGID